MPSTINIDSTTGWILVEFTWDGSSLKRFHNGTQNGSTATFNYGSMTLDSWGLLGAAVSSDPSYSVGDIALYFVRDSIPTSAEQSALWSYVRSSYPGVM